MDQLHEEMKQPLLSLTVDSESSDSDEDEPNHHNKRLLGGTSVPHNGNLQDGMALKKHKDLFCAFTRVRDSAKKILN